MIDPINIKDSFNRNEIFIINILIEYYGREYSEIIKERLENVFFDFSSTPEEDYKFLKSHENQINNVSKIIIKERYKNYKRIQNESRKLVIKQLLECIQDLLLECNLENIDIGNEKFLSLFMDNNFNSGCIDAFSSKSITLLNKYDAVDSLKESILNDQNEFRKNMEVLGINLNNLNEKNVDSFIKYRKEIQKIYKDSVILKSRYGKNMFKEIKKRFAIELSPEELNTIFLRNFPSSMYIYSKKHNDYNQIIKIPLIYLINIGKKALDVTILHEVIHKIETDKNYVGISIHDDRNTNNIINEIRTQYLALKFTKQLHEEGIFIYDNPDDYNIEKECAYEVLFPLTQNFIDEYEDIISDCAINNTPNKLYEYFGEDWKEFSEQIDYIYYEHMKYYSGTNSIPYIYSNDKITKLISSMASFKRQVIKHV